MKTNQCTWYVNEVIQEQVICWSLANREDINAVNTNGQTLLHTAVGGEKDYPELRSILLDSINTVDKDGNQPLHLTCKQRHFATVNLFLSYWADVTALNKQKKKTSRLGK